MGRVPVAVLGLWVLAANGPGQTVNPFNPTPTRIVGQPRLTPVTSSSPNAIEGREMFLPQSVAFDRSSTPPILYVADSLNNRVLAFRNPAVAARGAAADLVIGQRDAFSSLPQGPNNANPEQRLPAGFTLPTSVAVDGAGNLYVADGANNRILRFPRPLEQRGDILQTDLVIGQRSITQGASPNGGNPAPSATVLNFQTLRTAMAIDGAGNLWVSDAGNNRVLRFPVAQLNAGREFPAADLVLGQQNFTTNSSVLGNDGQLNRTVLGQPSGLAFDATGRLYVVDAYARIMMYTPPFQIGMGASRFLGIQPVTQGQQFVPTQTRVGFADAQGRIIPPEGVFCINNTPYVIDSPNNRILRYDVPEQWAAETREVPSPAAVGVIGQPDFLSRTENRGSRGDADNGSFFNPVSAVFTGTDVWVADASNNRVLGFPVSASTFTTATRLLGQQEFFQRGANGVAANGFFFSGAGTLFGGGVAVDYTSTPARLYVADPGNNRVLGFRDARNVKPGDAADIVIGQVDFFRAIVNTPTGDPLAMGDTGLNSPAGVAVDSAGNLWVADTSNGRVVRFPRPFDTPGTPRANLCLGQSTCFGRPQREVATASSLNSPWGIAFLFDGSVLVSDPVWHRVLLYRRPAGGDFTTGQAATTVFGQTNFGSVTPGSENDKLNRPRFISTDTDDRLYVADAQNNRIVVYRQQTSQQQSGLPAVLTIPVGGPTGVTVSPQTGNIWVASPDAARVYRYQKFQDLQLNPDLRPDELFSQTPVAIALDPQDNPVVSEGINRVAFYFPRLVFRNAASYSSSRLAPGMIAILGKFTGTFAETAETASGSRWPTSLGDVEILVNEQPAPIYLASPTTVYFQVPTRVRPPGTIDVVVQRASSQQVLGAATFTLDVAAPGFFTTNQAGTGQLAALNEDNSVNSPANGAARGSVVQLFGTGIGIVANQPPDGQPAQGLSPAPSRPTVVIGNSNLAADQILYFGLAPNFIGLFQLNVRVPANAVPNQASPVVLLYQDVASNEGPNGPRTIVTTIWVR
jgi:uncharacterized protein (TIGR03437 family)